MKWTLKWLWCVEMTMPDEPRAPWLAMYCCPESEPLVDVTRDEAIERASKLCRFGGRYSYRVRPFRVRPAP